VKELPDSPGELWDEAEERRTWSRVMFPFLILGFLKGAGDVAGRGDAEQLLTPAKRDLYFGKSLDYAAKTVGTTRKMLQEQITEAIDNGEGVDALAGRINEMYGSSMGYRSVRIARTQLTNTIADGNLEALREEGREYKRWSTVIDGRERPTHHDADGQVVGIDEPFTVGGSQCDRPGDDALPPEEAINCRCDVVAADTPEESRLRHGRLFLAVHGALERRYVIALRAAFRAQRGRILSRLAQ
jgi:SPP1 gp7 family putative phage head morphogenesis protein